MKTLYLILMTSLILSCNDSKVETTNTKEVVTETNSTEEAPELDDLLLGTWYAKEILINGGPDPDNYPVNNDELTLNEDGSMITIDKTFNLEEEGTWELLSKDKFKVVTEDMDVVFQILKLTENVLETRMVTEVADFKIYYKREK